MNSKVLAKELKNYQENVSDGGVFDPDGLGNLMQKEAVKSDIPIVNLLGSLKGNACLEIYSYWCFRDEIQEYQKRKNISSISFKEINWDGFILRYPEKEDQLIEMPQDKKIVERYKNKVIDFFIKFTENKLLKNYNLCKVEYDDIYTEYTPQNIEDIRDSASNFKYAYLIPKHPNTHPVYEGGTDFKKIAYWSRDFTLGLHNDDLDDPVDTKIFEVYKQWDHEPAFCEI
jgi:hypothetical protein